VAGEAVMSEVSIFVLFYSPLHKILLKYGAEASLSGYVN
jgi:hypothetical protein